MRSSFWLRGTRSPVSELMRCRRSRRAISPSRGSSVGVDVIVPNFSALPYALIGTERIAIMHRMHAEYFARFMPISILSLPCPIPKSMEQAQWLAMRSSDEGIQWILHVLREQAMQVAKKLRPVSSPLPGSMSMPPVLETTHSTSLS